MEEITREKKIVTNSEANAEDRGGHAAKHVLGGKHNDTHNRQFV